MIFLWNHKIFLKFSNLPHPSFYLPQFSDKFVCHHQDHRISSSVFQKILFTFENPPQRDIQQGFSLPPTSRNRFSKLAPPKSKVAPNSSSPSKKLKWSFCDDDDDDDGERKSLDLLHSSQVNTSSGSSLTLNTGEYSALRKAII